MILLLILGGLLSRAKQFSF